MRKSVASAVLSVVMGLSMGQTAQADGLAGAYLAARQAGAVSDFSAAAGYYSRALTRDPGNPQLLEATTLTQLSLGNLVQAIPVARKMEADGVRSQISHMVLIGEETARSKFSKIVERIEDGRGVGPLVDGLVKAWAQLGAGDVSAALASFDKVADERGMAGFALYHKVLALGSAGDFEAALALIEENPNGALQMTWRSAITRLEILSQLERSDDAIALIDQVFGADLDPELRALRATLVAGETLPFVTIRSAHEGIAEVFYSVADALSNEAGVEYTLLYSRIAEYLRPDHTDAILLSAQLLDELQRYDLAVATYKRVDRDNPSYLSAELGRAEALRRADRMEAAIEVLEQLTRSHGDMPAVFVNLGDFRRQLQEFDLAIAAYDAALAQYDQVDRSQWFIYYARAISHERLDHWELAEADFRKALELNPDQPQVLNYLGYSLVEQQVKLDEALSMIQRAVEERPDSGYIVDSLGWVLFRLGRYEEAVPHMERAAELMPVDPVVNDHLGDVLWAVGRKREADFQWRRALSFFDSEVASEEVNPDRIRQKLDLGLDAVLVQEGAEPLRVGNDDN